MLIIGIAGGTGSGKTTVVKKIIESLPPGEVVLLPQDSYYKDNSHVPVEKRQYINFDHPDAFDTDMMIEHLQQLREGHAIECPTYDYTIHNRAEETITIEPWRSAAFPVIKDLVVNRSAYDQILQAGGFISVRTNSVPDANAIPIAQADAEESMDAAACIGCGACHEACPWHMPTVNPETGKSSKCIACGACVAGCPSGALSIVDWDAVTSAAQAAYMDL